MKKTALVDFIKMCKTCSEERPSETISFNEIAEVAAEYLGSEEQQIIDAYNKGMQDAFLLKQGKIPSSGMAKDYYDKLFNNQ